MAVTASDGHARAAVTLPAMDELDRIATATFLRAVGPLFEHAPCFLGRLAAARPYGSAERLFGRAREIARAMPEPEQLELVDAHPRLGAPADEVSRLSFAEQGYGGDAGRPAGADLAAELDALNDAYEARFGFRYCVFVAGRDRAALVPEMRAALGADRAAELARALDAVVDIALDRHRKLTSADARR